MAITKKRRIGLIIGISLAILVISVSGVIIFIYVNGKKEFQMIGKLKMQIVHTIPREDSAFFAEETWSRMKVDFRWENIYRQVTYLVYDQHYQIIMAQADFQGHTSIPDIVHLKDGYGGPSVSFTYQRDGLIDHGDFYFRLGPPQLLNNIIVTYSGNKAQTLISNDSIVAYHISCANLSVRYADDSPVDIFLTGGRGFWGSTNLSLDLVLARRNNEVYFLFIVHTNYKAEVRPIIIGDLLKK